MHHEQHSRTKTRLARLGIPTFGFRPFFLAAAVWATLSMVLWVSMLTGVLTLPTVFDPVSWHAHEFLFVYLSAVVGGFLLTAVPNWSGRLPVVGWPLAVLVGFWMVGRVAVACSEGCSPLGVAIIDLSGLVVLWGYLAREIVLGRNWKKLVVLAILSVLILGNGIFHWEAAHGIYAASGVGLRVGLAAGIMMIALIGGRAVQDATGPELPCVPCAANGSKEPFAVLRALALRLEFVFPALIGVTSRKVIWLFLERFRLRFVPVLHRLQGRLAARG